jgi:transcriptional regulator with XRE-family HTH domain
MKAKKQISYLRAYRLRWGLSQKELAYLLGWKSEGVVSRLEKKQRPPTARILTACFIIFGTPAADLFPGLFSGVEDDVMRRVWEMYERVQGHPSKLTKSKIELLEDAIARAEMRKRESDS